jgi:methionyl-tRNA formyltransferase
MIPTELEVSTLDLPSSDHCRIVVITGNALRHDRFALRLQAEFPGLVVAWLQCVPASPRTTEIGASRLDQFRKLRAMLRSVLAGGPQILLSRVGQRMVAKFGRETAASQRMIEQRMFGDEIEQLKKTAYLSPKTIQNPNAAEIIEFVNALEPYFILTLGGPRYGKELRDCARGLALNQHDGWCPEYRGSYTVDWALYHRDLSKIANTVHVLTSGMDAGPILRRSIACLAIDDTPESCFARSVALETELMCETVRELIQTKKARIFPQPQFTGYTYVGSIPRDIKNAIRRDLRRGLIKRDIARRTAF